MFEIKKVIIAGVLCCTVCFASSHSSSDEEGKITPPGQGTSLDGVPTVPAREHRQSLPQSKKRERVLPSTNPKIVSPASIKSDDSQPSSQRGPMSEETQKRELTPQEKFDDFVAKGTAEGYYRAGLIANEEKSKIEFVETNIPMELYKIIDAYFKSESQENKFDDYISFLKACPQYHYVKYRLGQVYEKTLQMQNAIEAYKEAGEYGEPELYSLGIKQE